MNMYSRILVPLDGSELSETSLEHAKAIAMKFAVPEVILLRVVEPLSTLAVAELAGAGADWLSRAEQMSETEARDYLAKIDEKLKKEGVATKTVMVRGRAAEVILDYTTKNKVDLIVMSTHGRSGVSRWVLGSIADKVLTHTSVPILIVSPPGAKKS
jgi:nucleotide-binding universal stress UspA family protein